MASWRENPTRLGFAVQLCTVRFLGNFLSDWSEIPLIIITHLTQQLRIEDTSWPACTNPAADYRRTNNKSKAGNVWRQRYQLTNNECMDLSAARTERE